MISSITLKQIFVFSNVNFFLTTDLFMRNYDSKSYVILQWYSTCANWAECLTPIHQSCALMIPHVGVILPLSSCLPHFLVYFPLFKMWVPTHWLHTCTKASSILCQYKQKLTAWDFVLWENEKCKNSSSLTGWLVFFINNLILPHK